MADNATPKIRILIADDHQIPRLGLEALLDADKHLLVGKASDVEAAIKLSNELQPDIILMDLRMPTRDAFEATQAIKAYNQEIKILIFTSDENGNDVFATLSAGADGYCFKGAGKDQICSAINAVKIGAMWLDPHFANIVSSISQNPGAEPKSGAMPSAYGEGAIILTEREQEVLRLIVEGLSNKEIARRLYLTIDTIKTHLRHLFEKLAVSDRTQAAVKAIREDIV